MNLPRIVGVIMLIGAYFIITQYSSFFTGFTAGIIGSVGLLFIITGRFCFDLSKNKK